MLEVMDIPNVILPSDDTRIIKEMDNYRLQGNAAALLDMRAPIGAMPYSNLFCTPPDFPHKDLLLNPKSPSVKATACTTSTTKRKLHYLTDDSVIHEERPLKTVKQRTRPIKHVRFQAFPEIHIIPSVGRGDSTIWSTRQELCNMKQTAKKFCATIDIEHELHNAYKACWSAKDETSGGTSGSECCYKLLAESKPFQRQRGLERWSSLEHYRARALRLLTCKTDFFIEQSKQVVQDRRDEDKLAAIYRKTSKASVQFALLLGRVDAIASETKDEPNTL